MHSTPARVAVGATVAAVVVAVAGGPLAAGGTDLAVGYLVGAAIDDESAQTYDVFGSEVTATEGVAVVVGSKVGSYAAFAVAPAGPVGSAVAGLGGFVVGAA
jgi:hypothetical protein